MAAVFTVCFTVCFEGLQGDDDAVVLALDAGAGSSMECSLLSVMLCSRHTTSSRSFNHRVLRTITQSNRQRHTAATTDLPLRMGHTKEQSATRQPKIRRQPGTCTLSTQPAYLSVYPPPHMLLLLIHRSPHTISFSLQTSSPGRLSWQQTMKQRDLPARGSAWCLRHSASHGQSPIRAYRCGSY